MNQADKVISKLTAITDQLITGTPTRSKRVIRITEELYNSDTLGIVRMVRTPFGVLIERVSESFCKMTGQPKATFEGKYLHHITGGSKDDDLKFCDQIDKSGAAKKIQQFGPIKLDGLILKEEDGVYTELITLA